MAEYQPGPSAFERVLAQQREKYLASLPQRLNDVELHWRAVRSGRETVETLRELFRLVHNLAGSGATFGIPQISDSAKPLKDRLRAIADAGSWPEDLKPEELEPLLQELREAIGAALVPV